MAFNPYQSLTRKLQPFGTSTTVSNPGYTQQQVLDSLAANPNAAGMPGGTAPYFQGGYTSDFTTLPSTNSSGTGGIDWAALIQGDPAYQQTLADMKAANVADQASRDAAIRRAIVNYGKVPDLTAAQQALGFDLGPIVDANTQQLAGQNQYSTEANLNHQYQLGLSKIRQQLAARGLLQSGELGYQLGEANRAFGNAENTATQNLLDALSGFNSQYTNAVNSRQQNSTQALLDALTRIIGLYGSSGGGGTPPAPTSTQTTAPAPATTYHFTSGNTSQAYPKTGPYIGTAPRGYALG